MSEKKITCVCQAFTFSDSSRVSWTPTAEYANHRRIYDVAVGIPAPLGGYFNQRLTTNEVPSAKASLAMILAIKKEGQGLK